MKARRPDSPPRKPRRRWRWHVPPAILHGEETLEGTEVLEEVTGETGLLLWQSLRDVTLWASFEAGADRSGLFAAEAGERRRAALKALGRDSEIRGPLATLAELLDAPADTEAATLTRACDEISHWADDAGHLATALSFAQAGALASPADAAAGLRVGKLARKKGENARAETWFRRTIGLARQAKDWESYSRAFLGLGNLYVQRGNYPVARHLHIRALRAARRHSMRDILAGALHDLFGIAVEMGQPREAENFARAAFEAYGPDHPRVPFLAHDVAYFWITLGHFRPALSVFQALLPQIRRPAQRILILADIARAAGGAREREAFREASDQVWPLLEEPDAGEFAARGLLDLAHGAASLGEWSLAEKAARRAQEVAREREEARVDAQADAILHAVRSERAVEEAMAGAEKVELEETSALAEELVRSLTEHSAAG